MTTEQPATLPQPEQANTIAPSQIEQRERSVGLEIKSDCKPERIPELQHLLELYRPKQRMRKSDKDLAKRILSLRQGYDGDVVKCILPECSRIVAIDVAELHHYNEIESDNRIPNLGPMHHSCNSSLNGRKREATKRLLLDQSRLGSVSERDHTTLARQVEPESDWTSREGEKHDVMRHRWNGWIHSESGIFRGAPGAKIRITALAKKAVHALGTGSSVTYRRYIEEDYYGGIFDYEIDNAGYKFVVYLGPKKDPSTPK